MKGNKSKFGVSTDETLARKRKRVHFSKDEEDMDQIEEMDDDSHDDDDSGFKFEDGNDKIVASKKKIKTSELFGMSDDDEKDGGEKQSAFEKQQSKIQKQIEQLEEELIKPKPWTLLGEASARNRPQNSLLEEDLEFDRAGKTVPIITVETTQSLEDMIKKRILDVSFIFIGC